MPKYRIGILVVILCFSVFIITVLFWTKVKTPLGISFAPLFQIAGIIPETANMAVGKALPIDSSDEKELGLEIANSCISGANIESVDYKYLNKLMDSISIFGKKPFKYRVFINGSSYPNAYALPGGNIFVTKGLLNTLKSEGELVSVLAHEMGHIELSHCFNAVKFKLTGMKIGVKFTGAVLDFINRILIKHSYSKTQEDEADNYAFTLLTETDYDPKCYSTALSHISAYYGEGNNNNRSDINVLRDYLASHPPTELRIEKYSGEADLWWKLNKNQKRYIGANNLKNRLSFQEKQYIEDWHSYQK